MPYIIQYIVVNQVNNSCVICTLHLDILLCLKSLGFVINKIAEL
jgi:hypothetical protein